MFQRADPGWLVSQYLQTEYNNLFTNASRVCLSVCLCVCVCVWMSRIRFAISAPIVSPIGSFSSSRRRAFCDTSFSKNSAPCPHHGPKMVQNGYLFSLSADCSERPRSAAASVRAASVPHWQGSGGRRLGWLSISCCAQIT